MPEGPSIVILKDEVESFKGKKVLHATGNTKSFDLQILNDQELIAFKSWGKHFLICFEKFTIRIHFMLWGSYRINERKDTPPRLSLQFQDGELNFYACSVKLIDEPLENLYDWSADVMNPRWNSKEALNKLNANPEMLVCDALLDQKIFSGVGNIIKNEVLFRIKVHPLSKIGKMPVSKKKELIREAVHYTFQFLEWKKEYTLKKHWLAHTKTICPRDHIPFHKEYLGKSNRRSFYCTVCQKLYAP